jgi:hypothetical protein
MSSSKPAIYLIAGRPVGETRERRPDLFDDMIRGYLEGPVSAATRVTSEELFLPLDYDRDMLHGTAHIPGTGVDGHLRARVTIRLFSSKITLRRVPR